MRKQTKLVAVLSAAALLAIGASMTSFAATGWAEENGTWVYYDKDGYQVTDTWKKSGNNWFYLNEDGEMATSTLVEDGDYTYYVDENGVMVSNRWIQMENEDYYDSGEDEKPENVWYYFQSTGKAYKGDGSTTSFKTINGKKYAFDSDGQMLFGWVGADGQRKTGDDAFQNGVYYCGDENDGARLSNAWANLYISDNGPGYELQDQEYVWFWFQTNGKKYDANDSTDKDGDGIAVKKINGYNYAFDADGVMRSEWQIATQATASNSIGYFSDIENGARKKGWFKAVPSEVINYSDNQDESEHWYYGNSDGKLANAEIKTINSKKYAFNEKAEMLSGLFSMEVKNNKILTYEKINEADEIGDRFYSVASTVNGKATGDAGATIGVYYFSSSDDDGSLKTGNQTVTVDGDTYQFSFKKDGTYKGQGITSKVDDKTLYVMGKKIKADTDYKYQVVDRRTGIATQMSVGDSEDYDDYCLINTSGNIMTGNSHYKDADGNYYHIETENGKKVIKYTSEK